MLFLGLKATLKQS